MVPALTEDEFKAVLPSSMRKAVNPILMMGINNVLTQEEDWEHYRDNLLGFANVLTQGKFPISKYLSAVRYAGYKFMGMTNRDAFNRTFPEKKKKWDEQGVSSKDQSSYHTAYNKSKLVVLIMEQAMIPTHILNQDVFQEAINTQRAIMMDTKVSPMVRMSAANSLLTHLKAPETKKIELDVGASAPTIHEDFRIVMDQMAKTQLEYMKQGGDVKALTNVSIVPDRGEVIDV